MKKNLVIFIPSIEDGGVEKNLFIISNYLAKKLKNINIHLISTKKKEKKFLKNINIISLKNKFWDNQSRYVKYILCLLLLINILMIYVIL